MKRRKEKTWEKERKVENDVEKIEKKNSHKNKLKYLNLVKLVIIEKEIVFFNVTFLVHLKKITWDKNWLVLVLKIRLM